MIVLDGMLVVVITTKQKQERVGAVNEENPAEQVEMVAFEGLSSSPRDIAIPVFFGRLADAVRARSYRYTTERDVGIEKAHNIRRLFYSHSHSP
jgi:hypothetical protein